MAEKEILQRGTVPTVNNRGERTASRPMNDEDREQIARNVNVFGGLSGEAEAAMRNRRKKIDDAVNSTDDPTHVHFGGNPGSSTGQ